MLPRSRSGAQVEGDGDAFACAAVGADLMLEPGWEENEQSRTRPDPFGGAGAKPAITGVGQVGGEYGGRRAAGVEHFEIAAQGRVGGDAAVVHVVRAGPEIGRTRNCPDQKLPG